MIPKIAITGVESTGKTTLALELKAFFQAESVPEYARKYLTELRKTYTQEDLLSIAEGQILAQKQNTVTAKASIVIYDTELTVIKIWYESLYGNLPAYIAEAYSKQDFDLYLLPYPDLVWQEDALREHSDEEARLRLFALYEAELKQLKRPYAIIRGQGQARLQNAIAAISKQLLAI